MAVAAGAAAAPISCLLNQFIVSVSFRFFFCLVFFLFGFSFRISFRFPWQGVAYLKRTEPLKKIEEKEKKGRKKERKQERKEEKSKRLTCRDGAPRRGHPK